MSENDYKIFEKIMSDDKLASCCNKAIKIWNLNAGLALKIFDIMSYRSPLVMKQIAL